MENKPFPFSVCKECCNAGGTADLTEVNEKIDALEKDKVDNEIYNDKMSSIDESIEEIENNIGDIDSALSELHNYAQAIISGGAL